MIFYPWPTRTLSFLQSFSLLITSSRIPTRISPLLLTSMFDQTVTTSRIYISTTTRVDKSKSLTLFTTFLFIRQRLIGSRQSITYNNSISQILMEFPKISILASVSSTLMIAMFLWTQTIITGKLFPSIFNPPLTSFGISLSISL